MGEGDVLEPVKITHKGPRPALSRADDISGKHKATRTTPSMVDLVAHHGRSDTRRKSANASKVAEQVRA
jgi:hypothetical protein